MEEEVVKAISAVGLAGSCTNERLIKQVEEDPDFIKIYNLFKSSKEQGEILKELEKIYENRKKEVIKNIKQKKSKFKKKILGEEYENIKNIMKSDFENKNEICEEIFSNCIKKADDELVKKFLLTDKVINQIKYSGFNLDNEILSANCKEMDELKYFSYIVYDPKSIALDDLKLEKEWEDFPIKWYIGRLQTSMMRELFNIYKK